MNHFERSPPGAERGMPNIGGDEPVKKLLIIYAPVCPMCGDELRSKMYEDMIQKIASQR